ncbi:MAG: hypothetical protein IH596_11315 [Bacteroidales bacterium]|nr:hypothetical protein [Bacteroidales bacterium]
MKKLYSIFLLAICVSVSSAYSQFQPLTGNELPGAVVVSTDNYTPETIWNYNSGAAPVLSEYGFTALLVQKFMVGPKDFKIEAYLMNTPEAAYGMYSTNILKCPIQDSITAWDCLAQGQYQSAYGRFYIVITNETGSASLFYSYTIMQKFMALNPQEPLKLPDVFNAPAFADNRNQVDFVCGMLGMQNSLLGWENLIVRVRFAMYAVILPDPRSQIYFAQITFPTQGDMYTFLTNAKLMQNGVPIPSYNDYGFLFREFVISDPSTPLTIYFLQSSVPIAIAEVTEN